MRYFRMFYVFTIYKVFIRLHLDCGGIIFDQAIKDSLHQRVETVQYGSVIAIIGIIRGISKEKVS